MLLNNISINPDTLPQIQEVTHTGHPGSFRTELVLLTTIPFAVLLALPVTLGILGFWLWSGLSLGIICVLYSLAVLVIHKSFPVRAYALRQLDISYKKGWIFYSNITVPFARIQHSEISQGPVDRLFNLVTLHIYTAGGSSSDLSIPGLPRDEAQRLRDFIARYHD